MAIIDIKVPQLSESVAEATLLQWKKRVGSAVAQDEIVIEIETDKVVLEVPAPAAGVITQILRQDGDTVCADEVIAQLDTEASATASPPSATPTPAQQATEQSAAPAAPIERSAAAQAAIMPSAAKLIAEQDIAVDQLSRSGRAGRITKGDVQSAMDAQPTARQPDAAAASVAPAHQPPTLTDPWISGRPEQRVPMSRLRARIAERLVESQQTNAILTTFNEVNMQAIIDLRRLYKEAFEKEHGVRLGFMSFFIKAVVHMLKKYPIVNASIDGNDIVYHGYFDIGIAVGSPRGLVVPILRNADTLSIAEIEKKIAEFGQKAKDGKLLLEELTGGTFSISNGGVFGSMLSTPIINPPQAAILGVHATVERAVVENGQIVIRPINYLALSYDHRLIDGREAVLALVAIKQALEAPVRLLLDL
jgi:2-oxoglutarate dehydrogenase E2 component (dihydrolipoamide succinyltransferase)